MPDTAPLRSIAVSRPPIAVASLRLASQHDGPAGIARTRRHLTLLTGGHLRPGRTAWHPTGLDRWFTPPATARLRPPLHLTLRRRHLADTSRAAARRRGPIWPSWPSTAWSSPEAVARFADDPNSVFEVGAESPIAWTADGEIDTFEPTIAVGVEPHRAPVAAVIPARHELFIGRSVLPDTARTPALPDAADLRAIRLDLPSRREVWPFAVPPSAGPAGVSPTGPATSIQPAPPFRLPVAPSLRIARAPDPVEPVTGADRSVILPVIEHDAGDLPGSAPSSIVRRHEPIATRNVIPRDLSARVSPFTAGRQASSDETFTAAVEYPFLSGAESGRGARASLVLHAARATRPAEPAQGLASSRRFVASPASLVAAAELASQVVRRLDAPIAVASTAAPFADRSTTAEAAPFTRFATPGPVARHLSRSAQERAALEPIEPERSWLGRAVSTFDVSDRGSPDQRPLQRWPALVSSVWRSPWTALAATDGGSGAVVPGTASAIWSGLRAVSPPAIPWLPDGLLVPSTTMAPDPRPEPPGVAAVEAGRADAPLGRPAADLTRTAFGLNDAVGLPDLLHPFGAWAGAAAGRTEWTQSRLVVPRGSLAPLRRATWQPDRPQVPLRQPVDAALTAPARRTAFTSPWTGLLLNPTASASAARPTTAPGTPPTLVPSETRRSMQVSPVAAPVAPLPTPSTLPAPARGGFADAARATPLSTGGTQPASASAPADSPVPPFVAERLARSAWGTNAMMGADPARDVPPWTGSPFAERSVEAPFARPMGRSRRSVDADAAPIVTGRTSPTWDAFVGRFHPAGSPGAPNLPLVPPVGARGEPSAGFQTDSRVAAGRVPPWPMRESPAIARSSVPSLAPGTGGLEPSPWVSPAASLVESLFRASRPFGGTVPSVIGRPFGDRHAGSGRSAAIPGPGPMVFRSPLPDRADPGEDRRGEAAEAMASSIGAPLPPIVRRTMERTFGMDLASVRIHSGSHAARATDLVAGRAMARGTDVFLPGGIADSPTAETMPLLAHELTHVAQHLGHRVPDARPPLTLAQRSAAEEHTADRIERRVADELALTLPTRSAPASEMTLARSPVAMPMPVSAPVQTVVQREEGDASPGPGATVTAVTPVAPGPSATAATPAGPTPDQLAEKVYALLERRLIVERERGGYRR